MPQAETSDGRAVAVKALSLRGLGDWKQLQLFEREAATLRGLSHPCIPAYLDYFEDDTEHDRGFFLVQVRLLGLGCAYVTMMRADVRLGTAVLSSLTHADACR